VYLPTELALDLLASWSRLFIALGLSIVFSVIVGITAATNRKGISQCLQADPDCLQSNSVMLEYSPHIVLLMIGTNDAISKIDLANAPTRLGKLIDTIYAQLPNILIVVAQPVHHAETQVRATMQPSVIASRPTTTPYPP